jgi:hypothetical protein
MKTAFTKKITPYIVGTILFTAGLSIASSYSMHLASAQLATTPGATTAGSFSAKGYMGILALSPNTMQAIGGGRPDIAGSVLGGNWSFEVAGGTLKDFKIDLNRLSLGGQTTGTITISGTSNATGAITPSPTNAILLRGNSTVFQGTANISVNGTQKWQDVPIIANLINGKLLNVSIDNASTGNQFLGVPLFGIVTTLTPKGM